MDNSLRHNQRLNAYTQIMARQQGRSLLELAERISRNHLKDPTTVASFRHELFCFVEDRLQKCQKPGPAANIAIQEIKQEYLALVEQDRQLLAHTITPYAVLKKNSYADKTATYVLYGVGILSGISQVILGLGLDWTGVGVVPGTLLMVNGINNIYENGYALLLGKTTVGPGRMLYRSATSIAGFDNRAADIIYGGIDLTLSVYGVTKLALKPEAWRLFRYINTDYIRRWRQMGAYSMVLEAGADVATLQNIYKNGKGKE
ncbi:DUF4225 domain-containing protein [Serratia rubidaea]|uniref:DUF4225 domain-containing protein n=1 Tax=Serratia rubidaea TaxID=61652 RepID=UPI0023B14991|nr:DUF4225 domain-containing protein [Serratia rubidaea]MDK1703563.1 DUF4225 domain-containing protein [Serratia rubidaea]